LYVPAREQERKRVDELLDQELLAEELEIANQIIHKHILQKGHSNFTDNSFLRFTKRHTTILEEVVESAL